MVNAHKIVHERFVHARLLGHNFLYQIRVRRTDDRDRSEAELEDALIILVGTRETFEDFVRIFLRKLQPIAENRMQRLNAWNLFRKLKLDLAVQVQRQGAKPQQQKRYHRCSENCTHATNRPTPTCTRRDCKEN